MAIHMDDLVLNDLLAQFSDCDQQPSPNAFGWAEGAIIRVQRLNIDLLISRIMGFSRGQIYIYSPPVTRPVPSPVTHTPTSQLASY